MFFKKPKAIEDYDPDKEQEQLKSFRSQEPDKNDERAMIWAALSVFLPPVLFFLGCIILVVVLIFVFWGL